VDNDYSIDLDEIAATIRTAEVMTMRFVTVGQRLLMDFRATEIDGPMLKLVDPAKSVQQRYASLRQLRPRFEPPEKIVSIWWPRFASSLATTGIWDDVLERVSASGHADAVRGAAESLAALIEMEREQQRHSITGEGFRTLWSASAKRR
jgi:hypothetical protein